MKDLQLLETKKQELRERFTALNASGNVCGMYDVINKVIENADDVRVGSLHTKLYVGDEIELFVSQGSYALSMTMHDRDNFRKRHCLEYVHNLPGDEGRGEVFSVQKYDLLYEEEFREDVKLPGISLMMSDRLTHMRVFRRDEPLGERTVDRKPFGSQGLQEYKEQFTKDTIFTQIRNEMANVLDKVIERVNG